MSPSPKVRWLGIFLSPTLTDRRACLLPACLILKSIDFVFRGCAKPGRLSGCVLTARRILGPGLLLSSDDTQIPRIRWLGYGI